MNPVDALLDKYSELVVEYADRTTREIKAGRCSTMRVLLKGMLQEYAALKNWEIEAAAKKGGAEREGQGQQ